MTNRISSMSSRSTRPVEITMNGLSEPSVSALGIGFWEMYSSGTSGRSRIKEQLIQLRELLLRCPNRAGEVYEPPAPVGEQAREPPEQRVEAGQLAQRDQRRTIGGVLVRARGDPGQAYPGTIRHGGHTKHAMRPADHPSRDLDPQVMGAWPPSRAVWPGIRDHGMVGSSPGQGGIRVLAGTAVARNQLA